MQHPESPFTAVWAGQLLDARHTQHERLHRLHNDRIGGGCLKRGTCGGKIGSFVCSPQQSVMTDPVETAEQPMQQKATDEFTRFQAHHLLAVAIGRVAYPTAHAVSIHAENALLIGDRHPVRIATEIFQHLRRTTQRLFGITTQSWRRKSAQIIVVVTAFGLTTATSYALSGYVDRPLTGLLVADGMIGAGFGILLGRRFASHMSLFESIFAGVVITVGAYIAIGAV
jgi:hypothetical protein